ncbi:MAG: YceD family protein [Actinomycetota bacterium]
MTLATIDVHELVGHPGASREETVRGTVEGLRTELAGVSEDVPVEADLLLESVVEGIFVTGYVRGTWRLRCARCLVEFDEPFDVPVHELFVPHPDEDAEDYPLDPESGLDPDQMVRDVVGVEMPFSPLHAPDCLGLCEVCGGNRNLGECPGHEQADPRFAVLADLFPADTGAEEPTT